MIKLEEFLDRFEKELASFIDRNYSLDNICTKMINYALYSRGKRVRPALLFLVYKTFLKDGMDIRELFPPAIALEMIHTYSLIHDDLPCMDNDSKRRSRYTLHVFYGQAQALLSGDALLTDSFWLLSNPSSFGFLDLIEDRIKLDLIYALSYGAGSSGMVQGQVYDIYASSMRLNSEPLVEKIRTLKTARLIQVGMKMGAILSKTDKKNIDEISDIGESLGQLFQIQDDLLDDTISTKTTGKDKSGFKLTALSNNTRLDLQTYVNLSMNKIIDRISKLPGDSDEFKKYVQKLSSRTF